MNTNDDKKPNKFWKFIKNNMMSTVMFIALVIVFIWALIKIHSTQNKAANEIARITEVSNQKIDSARQVQLEQTATVFSWAIRSELMRQNIEQVDQFFMSFIKQPGVNKISLIEPSTNKVLLSTDKKDESTELKEIGLNTNALIMRNNDNIIRAISPIMGLNEKIGILVIDFDK